VSAPIRVLVADDERNLRELLVRELGRKGHAATGVADGRAALDHLKEDVPDVLLLDIMVPQLNGWESVGGSRRTPSWRRSPSSW